MKILLADDDPISLEALKKYLHEARFDYAIAENGQQAWEMLIRDPTYFTLVIADRIMPKLHGLELLLRMKQHTVLKNIPFVIITGAAEKQEMVTILKAGAFDFLYKPVERDLLLAIVKKAAMGVIANSQ